MSESRQPFETLSDHERREMLRAVRESEVLTLKAEDMRRIAPYLNISGLRVAVAPRSTDAAEIGAALTAERLLNAAADQ